MVWFHSRCVECAGCMQPQAHGGRTTEVSYICVQRVEERVLGAVVCGVEADGAGLWERSGRCD